jgi:hypothetical protein
MEEGTMNSIWMISIGSIYEVQIGLGSRLLLRMKRSDQVVVIST